ncbi:methionyl-tRNA formyltransferase [Sulfurirhabdus autotrophica]|uniref:Methionyl-tRNA formyltransferase n=1 Tax=Sulfurirhabdus autotrophica TaxID=1706046 RepID=A0A4R3XRS6_9PROT|nr:methionyl-tRNA formyltransferase [Sulfurirhabdus autotrophica]TCV80250.1 methionyl-tRNA formyltransferase [Sulfurirhabdus autotrophica]
MRIIFAGTPEFAAQALTALLGAGHDIPLVLTQPDRPAGRGMKATASAVKQLAEQNGIPVWQPTSLKDPEIQSKLSDIGADVMVVAAYGLLLPQDVLEIPLLGCLNIHASLLPRWRGAAPIQRALLAGDKETGICIMQMDVGLDTGDVLMQSALPIDEEDTAQTLHDKLAVLGAENIVKALEWLPLGKLNAVPQNDAEATYAAKLNKVEARLDWQKSAVELARAVRAYNPFPVAQLMVKGEIVRIWKAHAENSQQGTPGTILSADKSGICVACGTGVLRLLEVQKAGGKRMPVAQFLQGNQLQAGDCCET